LALRIAGGSPTAFEIAAPAVVLARQLLRAMKMTRWGVATAMLLALGTLVGAGIAILPSAPGQPAEEVQGPPATVTAVPAMPEPVRTHLYGDPLPAGAMVRLGTVQWRLQTMAHRLVFLSDEIIAYHDHGRTLLVAASTGKEIRTIEATGLITPDGRCWSVVTGTCGT
jgi:hypothetical protein